MVTIEEVKLEKINSAKIILGFTGPLCSGCTYISEMIPDVCTGGRKYKYYKVSDVLREMKACSGSVFEMQDIGDNARKDNGPGYLIYKVLEKVNSDIEAGIIAEEDGIILDGIKNEGELKLLRQFPNFLLFSVQADRDTRRTRAIKSISLSEGRFSSIEQFDDCDSRDELEEDNIYGQQVKRCDYYSDIIILNNIDIATALANEKRDFITKIYRKYIKLIENTIEYKERDKDSYPTRHELCMTIAYALSKNSSCLKRKVGALIVDIEEIKDVDVGKNSLLSSIISSGYNEVPIGSYKCALHPDYQKCYRDYLQEVFVNKIEHCPKCGKAVSLPTKCNKCNTEHGSFVKLCTKCGEEFKATCECGVNILNEYLPGGKDTPGKLLDMCRALHAEEITLLNLSKSGQNTSRNQVLYVTTQPCNMCANKIVASGIKKIVYAEPYSMVESKQILDNAKVEQTRFEGVKSSAYFKLYT